VDVVEVFSSVQAALTRAHCHSAPLCAPLIGILHTNENWRRQNDGRPSSSQAWHSKKDGLSLAKLAAYTLRRQLDKVSYDLQPVPLTVHHYGRYGL
jgi:hypothetical protein